MPACSHASSVAASGRAPSRTWIWLGAVAGLGIQNKHSMVFFGVAAALAILLTPERFQFTQRWIWLAGLIAFVIALPNIIWQVAVVRRIDLAARFPRRPARSRHRFHLLIALAEFIVMHGKNYYVAPAYPMLFAAGGAGFERILALRFRWLKPAIAFLVVVSAVVLAPVVLPILSPEKLLAYMRAIHFEVPRTETSHTAALPQLYADQFGWEEMVRSVARVYASCLRRSRNALPFFVRITAKRARSISLARNTDYRQRSPAIKITFIGDRTITQARS
ncbi:MAG: glycosyltransferase family 39 protein [Verrucomicrobia bacterium]|nr:MAG: glycosyltransferase family 39 protein [Verrucomicrobiota bacterium]